MNCVICSEALLPEDIDRPAWVPPESVSHPACLALGVVGHDFGVCHCTGFDTPSRVAALELWRRLQEKFGKSTAVEDNSL